MLESKPFNLIDYVAWEFPNDSSPIDSFPSARKAAYDWLISKAGCVWPDWAATRVDFSPIALQFGLYSALRGLPLEHQSLVKDCDALIDYDSEGGPIGHFQLSNPQLLYKDNYAAFFNVVSVAHLLTGLDYFEFEYQTTRVCHIRSCIYDREIDHWLFKDHK